MTTTIFPAVFVEKYKLIPKQLRLQFLGHLRQMPYLYDEELELDIFDDLMMILFFYETVEEENYTYLRETLKDDVYLGDHRVYHDVISCLLRYLEWRVPLITYSDVMRFRKQAVLRQIENEVAFRPGNAGYEVYKEHFEACQKLF